MKLAVYYSALSLALNLFTFSVIVFIMITWRPLISFSLFNQAYFIFVIAPSTSFGLGRK